MRRGLEAEALDALFPFYVAFGADLRIQQLGSLLRRRYPDLRLGSLLLEHFRLRSPGIELSAAGLYAHSGALFLFDLLDGDLTLRGQVLSGFGGDGFLLAAAPWFQSAEELERSGLCAADFPAHDHTLEHLLLQQTQEMVVADSQRLLEELRTAAEERERLTLAERALEHDLNASAELHVRVDQNIRVLEFRAQREFCTGEGRPEAMIGLPLREVLPTLHSALVPELPRLLEGMGPRCFEFCVPGDDTTIHFDCRAATTLSGDVLVVGRDVSDRRGLEAQLRYQALHDVLTGLPNRMSFNQHLGEAIRGLRRRQDGRTLALLMIDLDDFKSINDAMGHSMGDGVLVEVARRISGCVRRRDLAARLGGDEFAVIVEGLRHPSQALEVAQRISRRVLGGDSERGPARKVRCSIGVAFSDGSVDEALLTRQADLAMYRAKSRGKGGVELFSEALQRQASDRLELKRDLEQALDRDEIVLHYQPIVHLDSGALQGVEALARWRHPRRGLLGPGHFIELAEESGSIVEVGRRILERACREVLAWEMVSPAARQLRLSVNLSARQLSDTSFSGEMAKMLSESGFDPRRLTLEITESQVVEDMPAAVRTLGNLRRLGTRIAIDDFGTGYSSLGYLEQLPIDVLKIDKAFVDRLDGRSPAALAEVVMGIGQSLGMQVIAEGIEEPVQVEALLELGCVYGQGFFFSPPVAEEALAEQLQADAPALPHYGFEKRDTEIEGG